MKHIQFLEVSFDIAALSWN